MCPCISAKNLKGNFLRKLFWKLARIYCLHTLWVKNLHKIAVSSMVKEREAILCVYFGEKKIENTKRAAIFGRETLWVEKEIEAILCCYIFLKIQNSHHWKRKLKQFCVVIFLSKIQNSHQEKFYLKIGHSMLLRYHLGKKLQQNRFISHG